MLICREYLKHFFELNQSELENNYPGITLDILMRHTVEFFDIKPDDCIKEESFFINEIKKGTPLSYITKTHFFYKDEFYTDQRVLIPRSETEILVEDAVKFLSENKHSSFRVAEVGVGSFALGLSLLLDSSKEIDFWGGDLSKEALDVAEINLFRLKNKLNKKHEVELALSDRLNETKGEFDLIVSNPPYIKRSQVRGVHHQVEKCEPEIALFLSDEEFDSWFDSFFKEAHKKLKMRGAFMMEGHEDNLKELLVSAEKIFESCLIKKDYTGRDRFLYCYKE